MTSYKVQSSKVFFFWLKVIQLLYKISFPEKQYYIATPEKIISKSIKMNALTSKYYFGLLLLIKMLTFLSELHSEPINTIISSLGNNYVIHI